MTSLQQRKRQIPISLEVYFSYTSFRQYLSERGWPGKHRHKRRKFSSPNFCLGSQVRKYQTSGQGIQINARELWWRSSGYIGPKLFLSARLCRNMLRLSYLAADNFIAPKHEIHIYRHENIFLPNQRAEYVYLPSWHMICEPHVCFASHISLV